MRVWPRPSSDFFHLFVVVVVLCSRVLHLLTPSRHPSHAQIVLPLCRLLLREPFGRLGRVELLVLVFEDPVAGVGSVAEKNGDLDQDFAEVRFRLLGRFPVRTSQTDLQRRRTRKEKSRGETDRRALVDQYE